MEVSCVEEMKKSSGVRDDFVPVAPSTECTGSRQKMVSAQNNLYKKRLIKSVDS